MDSNKVPSTTSHNVHFANQTNSGGMTTVPAYGGSNTTYSVANDDYSAPTVKIGPAIAALLVGLFLWNLALAIIVSWVWQ